MDKKDILKLKVDLGLCVDTLMSIFIYFCISNKWGIIYFVLSLIIEAFCYVYELRKGE